MKNKEILRRIFNSYFNSFFLSNFWLKTGQIFDVIIIALRVENQISVISQVGSNERMYVCVKDLAYSWLTFKEF